LADERSFTTTPAFSEDKLISLTDKVDELENLIHRNFKKDPVSFSLLLQRIQDLKLELENTVDDQTKQTGQRLWILIEIYNNLKLSFNKIIYRPSLIENSESKSSAFSDLADLKVEAIQPNKKYRVTYSNGREYFVQFTKAIVDELSTSKETRMQSIAPLVIKSILNGFNSKSSYHLTALSRMTWVVKTHFKSADVGAYRLFGVISGNESIDHSNHSTAYVRTHLEPVLKKYKTN
jgi:hypothetical protein